MAQYKLNWNYEPGVDDIKITTTQASYASTDYLVFTEYDSKRQSKYIYDSSQGTVTEEANNVLVLVKRANNPNTWETLDTDEQLAHTYVDGSSDYKYWVEFPGRYKISTWNAAVAWANSAYQLPKKTNGSTSEWYNLSYLTNNSIELFQRDTYFVPINTNINLNEEFRTRLYNYNGLAGGYTFQLPNTYQVNNTVDSFSYGSSSIYNANPFLEDLNGNPIDALSRDNNHWNMNIPSTVTCRLWATYTKYKDTLKPTQSDDIAQAYQNNNILFTSWNVKLQTYDPTIAKLLSNDMYNYRQDGYDYMYYTVGSGHNDNGWKVIDSEGALPAFLVNSGSTFGNFYYLDNKTILTEGLDFFQLRGVSEQRRVELRGRFRCSALSDLTFEYGLSADSELEGTSATIANTAVVTKNTNFNLTEAFGPAANGTTGSGSYDYITGARKLYLYVRWFSDNSWSTWKKLNIFQLYSDRLGVQAVNPTSTSSGLAYYPDIYLTTQVYYY